MAEEGKERRKIPGPTEIPRRPTEKSGLTLNSRNMFRVFRLRSGRDSPTPPLPLCLPLSSPLLLMMCPRNAERDFISLHRAPSHFPLSICLFLSLFLSHNQIFHLDLILVLSLRDTIGPRDLPKFSTHQRSDHFGSCYVFSSLFTTIVKN